MTVLPYKSHQTGKKEQVAQMFDNIAHRYDMLNRLLSSGIDIYWRKRAVSYLRPEKPKKMLDVATGTADFALEALSLQPEQIIGVDISEGMLEIGRKKLKKRNLDHIITLQKGDSEGLPFPDNSFDAVTVAFGVRNFEDLEQGLSDIYRVLRPGGTMLVLEFSQPQSAPFKQLYGFYMRFVLPGIGRLVSGDHAAYTYLPESVQAFPYGSQFTQILHRLGFQSVQCVPLTFGICSIYLGKK